MLYRPSLSMRSLLDVASGIALQMAAVTPIISHSEYKVYASLHHTHRGFVPDYSTMAVVLCTLGAYVSVIVAPLSNHFAAYAIGTLLIVVSTSFVIIDHGNSSPGAALWLVWASVILSNWALASRRSSDPRSK